jgi:NAD(P)-dependent dehydrogenase (short-subunit alcohol dehydrogenase family)
MPTLLITGANRGLGLEFTRQYAEAGWHVLACCRNPEKAEALQALASRWPVIHTHTLDISDFKQIELLAASIDTPIDVLINNAGVYPDSPQENLSDADYEHWLEAFRINSLAPHKMTLAFKHLVAKSAQKKIINITSKMGSIADNTSGGSYLYRSSKTGLNMVTKSLAIDLRPLGITTIVMHPGWVQTDMGGPNALIDTVQSISGMRKVIASLTLSDAGKFYAFDGKEIPW